MKREISTNIPRFASKGLFLILRKEVPFYNPFCAANLQQFDYDAEDSFMTTPSASV
jgi:hypothetical protein